MKRKHFLATALVVLALGAGAGYFARSPDSDLPADSPVRVLFERTFKDANDRDVALNQYRDHVIVVNFWATWCAPCIQEMPELSAMQNEFADHPVQFVGLAIDDKDKVRQFEKRLTVDYPLLVLGASGIELARQFGNKDGALPFTFVLNKSKRIVDRKIGIVQMDHLREVINQSLAN